MICNQKPCVATRHATCKRVEREDRGTLIR
jgi:hypothetical protein